MMVRVAGVKPALFSKLDFEVNRRFHRIEVPRLAPVRTTAEGSTDAPRRQLRVETTRPIYAL
jgi:hypothetical protein